MLRSTAIVQLAAYEPALFYQQQHAQIVVPNAPQQAQQSQQGQPQQQQQFQQQQFVNENDLLSFQQNLSQQQLQQTQNQQQQQQSLPQSQQFKHQSVLPVAQPLLPSSILSTVPVLIEMFDDTQIDENGTSGKV